MHYIIDNSILNVLVRRDRFESDIGKIAGKQFGGEIKEKLDSLILPFPEVFELVGITFPKNPTLQKEQISTIARLVDGARGQRCDFDADLLSLYQGAHDFFDKQLDLVLLWERAKKIEFAAIQSPT